LWKYEIAFGTNEGAKPHSTWKSFQMNTMPQQESLVKALLEQMETARDAFGQERVYLRAMLMVLAEIMSFGSHQVTDLLRSMGLVEEDWIAWYRLFQKESRRRKAHLGEVLVEQTWQESHETGLYVVGVDTTSVPRNSRRMQGTGWAKCPRNPPWDVGMHWAQRFLNLSWLAPMEQGYNPRATVTSVQWSAWVYSSLPLTTYRRLVAANEVKRPTA
jgi:hypothetical protein